jgi:MSHA biogenesis protein MshI
MQFFRKANKNPGWMAITFSAGGVCATHVVRATAADRPAVRLASFIPEAGVASPESLERIGKDLALARFQCTTMLHAGEYQLLSVEAPNVPPDELKTAIRWKLKDMLDYHIDDATLDVLDVPIDKNAAVRTHSMYAIAARNQLIQQRQALFAEAKIPLTVIDIPEMAQRNFSALLEPEGRGLAFLSFDDQGGLLTVTYAGELYLSRRIDLTLAQLRQGDETQRNNYYDRITLELQRSLDHFDRQYHFINVSKMMLGPMGDAAIGLREYLGTNLYVPVEQFDLETVLEISAVPELKQPDMQQRFFMSLGTALRYEEKSL